MFDAVCENVKNIVITAGLCAVCAASAVQAVDGDVQRQLQWREQQGAELRLRMQQQQDRALAVSPRPPHVDLRLRQLEIQQHQRLEQTHDQALREQVQRGGAVPHARQKEAESLSRLEQERQIEASRAAAAPQAVR